MAVKLIGTDTAGGESSGSGYIYTNQFTCAVSGILASIKAYCLANSNVRVAIYSDSGSNTVGNLLQESASTAITSGDWRSIDLAATVNITSGTKYWLACQVATTGGIAFRFVTCVRGYKTYTYGAFPADGTDFGYADNTEVSLQGWGTSGWAHISKVLGVASASIAKIDSVPVANISKVNGVAV
jgi:hypothetical protein